MKERGSWTWWIRQLDDCASELPTESDMEPEQLPLLARNPDPAAVEEIRRALQFLGQTRSWPELAPAVSRQLHVRLAFARWVCASNRAARAPARTESFAEVLQWLTNDCWAACAPMWADRVATTARMKRRSS
jgi:hypothetical protein